MTVVMVHFPDFLEKSLSKMENMTKMTKKFVEAIFVDFVTTPIRKVPCFYFDMGTKTQR